MTCKLNLLFPPHTPSPKIKKQQKYIIYSQLRTTVFINIKNTLKILFFILPRSQDDESALSKSYVTIVEYAKEYGRLTYLRH